jgi:YD repeat-containing protein
VSATLTYNSDGQVLTVTNAKNETTTFAYDTGGDGYLLTVTGPVSGSTTTLAYDAYGRLATVTGPDGYAMTTTFDALNRVTRQTYPDGTFDALVYQRLDLVEMQDRLGRITRTFYDDAGRVTATRDPLGRIVRQEWCACGLLLALVDANGHRTSWDYDDVGRVLTETRHDGTTTTSYTYDTAGRLSTITDPIGQVTTRAYLTDDRLSTLTYTNETISTPTVTFTYDSVYPRVATMVDGTGTTSYAYVAPGTTGRDSWRAWTGR